jgi:two-component system, OmpR family, sensor histidine kinase ArlS
MTIKSKISFLISILFTIIFGVVCGFVIYIFSIFRQQEFEERLNEKALTSIRLLIDVKEVDNELLKIIDQNSINKLYDEKTLIFNGDFDLIYSSLDDTKINWNAKDLKYLKEHKTFFRKDGDNELFGIFYDTNKEDYFALISANDNYGKRKLYFLIYLMIGACILFIVATWLLTFYVVKIQLVKLDNLHKQIKNINELNIESTLNVDTESKNEIDLMSNEFNFLMNRLSESYQKQKEFTSQASHELRTPLARISTQLENQLQNSSAKDFKFLTKIFKDINELSELINSLLILSKIDNKSISDKEITRVDEAIYNSIEHINKQYPKLKVSLDFDEIENIEDYLEVNGNQNLLEIAFSNLIKNAYLYSENQSLNIEITLNNNKLKVLFINNGEILSNEDAEKIYEPFTRGNNNKGKSGLGLGLRIVHRILTVYGFKIKYSVEDNKNTFTITF